MAKIIGIDGCKKGWLLAKSDSDLKNICIKVVSCISEIEKKEKCAKVVTIDIPIGLNSTGEARQADIQARAKLGGKKACRVFTPPSACVLKYYANKYCPNCPNKEQEHVNMSYREKYRQVREWSKKKHNKGISAQCFGIFPKMCEVNHYIRKNSTSHIYEVHPEISFWEMNGGKAIADSKKTKSGQEKRKQLLCKAGIDVANVERTKVRNYRGKGFKPDDLLDALVALWSAKRILRKKHYTLPHTPIEDACIKNGRAIWV